MDNITRFTANDLTKYTNQRSGEVKFGERIHTIPKDEDILTYLTTCEAEFVLLGIPEDVGVRANYGRAGTSLAWHNALKSIANLQHNKFCKGSRLLILGEINVADIMNKALHLDHQVSEGRKKLRELVEAIDKEVSYLIRQIIMAGKIPVVIGGGHNNAYGNIKGAALAKGRPVNAVNFDAHTDFRALEGRHSGNGFSYAFEEGFLKKYFVFGLHENYISKPVMENIKKVSDRIKFNTYEQIAIRQEKNFREEMVAALSFVDEDPFGLEIDMDAILNTASSAITPSGFSAEQARQFVHYFGSHVNVAYLHICEGAPVYDNEKNSHLTGKLIAYLLSDFMKARPIT